MPVQILEAIKWVVIISTIGFWIMILIWWGFKYLIEDIDEGGK